MIVYHGSHHRFTKLRISKSLVNTESTLRNEGCGIYITTDKEVALSYGKYLYTLYLNDDAILDFRKKPVCDAYLHTLIKTIRESMQIPIDEFLDLSNLSKQIQHCNLSISGIGSEISQLLDNNETFYMMYSEHRRERLYAMLRTYDKKHLKAYFFPYHIQNIGVIKDISPDVVQILSRTDTTKEG